MNTIPTLTLEPLAAGEEQAEAGCIGSVAAQCYAAVARAPDGSVILTVFEGGRGASVELSIDQARELGDLLIRWPQ